MTPNAVAQMTDSDLISALDLDVPQNEMNDIFLKHGNQGISYLMVRSLGFETKVKNDTYKHYEKDASHDNIKINGTVTQAGAGADIALVLHADSLDADNNYYPRQFDGILFTNEVTGWIVSIAVVAGGLGGGVDQVTLTIRPNEVIDVIGTVTAGDLLVIHTGSFSEGSGMPDEAISKTSQFVNEAQIIKEAIGATGTSLVTETWIEMWNKAQEFQGIYSPAYFDLDYRMLTKIDGMFWFGKRTSTTANRAVDSVTGHVIKTSEGLVPTIRRIGNVNTYTPGAFTVTKFDEYERIYVKEWVPSNVPVWMPLGLEIYQEMENVLVEYFKDTNIIFTKKAVNDMLFKGSESLGASVNFKYLQKSGRTFLFNRLDGFSNQKTYGTTGYDMPKMGFGIPLDTSKDPKTQNDIPSIGTRYRAMGDYNRRFITATLSGIGASHKRQPVTTIDKTNTYQFCHMGNEFFGVNRMILIDNT